MIRNQTFIAFYIGFIVRHRAGIAHADPMFNRRAIGGYGLNNGTECRVKEDGRVFGVANHPGDLFRVQPRVDGVHNRADTGNRIVNLDMAVIIPGDRGDPVTGLHACGNQSIGQFFRSLGAIFPSIAVLCSYLY